MLAFIVLSAWSRHRTASPPTEVTAVQCTQRGQISRKLIEEPTLYLCLKNVPEDRADVNHVGYSAMPNETVLVLYLSASVMRHSAPEVPSSYRMWAAPKSTLAFVSLTVLTLSLAQMPRTIADITGWITVWSGSAPSFSADMRKRRSSWIHQGILD